MTCVHRVKWSVKRPEDCRFRLSVSHYKDRIVAPAEYAGATVITPSDSEQVLPTKDKLVRDNITVMPAPEPDLETLTVDSLTQHGTFLPTGDGFSQVTVEEDWDGTLYPITDETDPLFEQKVINAKHIPVVAGDTVIVEGMGRGRWFGWYRGVKGGDYASNSTTYSPMANNGFGKARYTLPIAADATLVLCGYEWTNDGTHSGNATYCFFGEYLHWKVIHAS